MFIEESAVMLERLIHDWAQHHCDLLCCVSAAGMTSAFATRMTGSQDLFAARWDGGLPGGLAAGRRPAFSINALEPPLSCDLLSVAGAAEDLERAETVARSLLLAMLVAQVRRVVELLVCPDCAFHLCLLAHGVADESMQNRASWLSQDCVLAVLCLKHI
jgi:hypothetical protein